MAEFLLAFLLMIAGHELGHDLEASAQRVQIKWRLQSTGLVWTTMTNCPDKSARIAGSGFRAQDMVARLASGRQLEKKLRLVSALNKAAYILVPASIQRTSPGIRVSGDLKTLQQYKPGAASHFLAVSALADLYKAYRPNSAWDLGFWQADNGSPGLVLNIRF